ncbi:MAG: Ku protein [Gemmatimonadetes bacterium]|nr:Ku protein [Gemmatimonadota bacterium]
MAARAIASATISFGLVSIPVKLYSSSESSASLTFNWIHKGCGSRLRQQYICAKDGTVIEKEDMVKGYEFSKGQYVLFTPEELKALEEKGDNTVAISEFVPSDKVERIYLDKVYYLGPDKGGERAYRLLREAMRETKLVGLGRYAARGKQYLVMVRPMETGIALEQLHYADEIRLFAEVPLGDGAVKKEELKLAVQLVKQVATKDFKPQSYRDEVRERVLELIEKKKAGEDITQAPVEEPKTQIIDLMEALKASLAAAEKKPAKRAAPARKKVAARGR